MRRQVLGLGFGRPGESLCTESLAVDLPIGGAGSGGGIAWSLVETLFCWSWKVVPVGVTISKVLSVTLISNDFFLVLRFRFERVALVFAGMLSLAL